MIEEFNGSFLIRAFFIRAFLIERECVYDRQKSTTIISISNVYNKSVLKVKKFCWFPYTVCRDSVEFLHVVSRK